MKMKFSIYNALIKEIDETISRNNIESVGIYVCTSNIVLYSREVKAGNMFCLSESEVSILESINHHEFILIEKIPYKILKGLQKSMGIDNNKLFDYYSSYPGYPYSPKIPTTISMDEGVEMLRKIQEALPSLWR